MRDLRGPEPDPRRRGGDTRDLAAHVGVRTADGWLCELGLASRLGDHQSDRFRSRTGRRASDLGLLPLELDEYLRLLDWTGRQLRRGKRGASPAHLAPILERLRVREESWLEAAADFVKSFGSVVGPAGELAEAAGRLGQQWLKGARAALQVSAHVSQRPVQRIFDRPTALERRLDPDLAPTTAGDRPPGSGRKTTPKSECLVSLVLPSPRAPHPRSASRVEADRPMGGFCPGTLASGRARVAG